MTEGVADGAAPGVQDLLGIQEAATLLGVTMRTLRFYEEAGF